MDIPTIIGGTPRERMMHAIKRMTDLREQHDHLSFRVDAHMPPGHATGSAMRDLGDEMLAIQAELERLVRHVPHPVPKPAPWWRRMWGVA